jgi:hypothetical protein
MNDIWYEPPSDKAELARAIELLATDISVFARNVFAIMGWDQVAPLSDIEEDIIRYAESGSDKTRIVLASRGIGKTHMIGGVLVPFRLFTDPNRKIVTVSRSEGHAINLLSLCKKVIASCWFLHHMRSLEHQKDNLTEYEVADSTDAMQPSIMALGIGGHLAGKRAHTVIADDIEDVNNTLTREARDRLENNTKEFKAWLYPDPANGPPCEIIYIGTFQHLEDSIYLRLHRNGAGIRCWPIRYPQANETTFRLAPLMAERLAKGVARPGEPAMPARFNIEDIAKREAEGHVWFQMQYMLSVQIPDADSYELRLCDLIVMPLDRQYVPTPITWALRDHNGGTDCDVPVMLSGPHDRLLRPAMLGSTLVPYNGTKATVDIAGDTSRDQIALCVMSMASGMFFCRHLQGVEAPKGGGRMTPEGGWEDGVHDIIAKTCRDHGVQALYYERNADPTGTWGQLMQAAVLRHSVKPGENPLYPDGWSCSVYPIHAVGQKEVRIIQSLRSVVGSHRLVVDESVVRPTKHAPDKQFQRQFARIKQERGCLDHDDLVDSLSMAVKVWTEANLSLTKDPMKASEDAMNRRIDEMKAKIKRGVDAMLGRKTQSATWARR